jgi:quercetin dioxygenase-like cupin family protein
MIQSGIGTKEGNAARKELKSALLAGRMKKQSEQIVVPSSNVKEPETIFPKGQKITNNNFTGTAWLEQLVLPDSLNSNQIGNVTFEPGARSNWHLHPGGQILMVIGGLGYYQEKGSPKKLLRKGDVIKCSPNIPHWHGASKDQMFIQVAITPMQNGPVVWLQPVTDEEYHSEIK